MLTFYCPHCWAMLEEGEKTCPHCGHSLEEFEQFTFEEKLLAALSHPVPEHRIMAAELLGEMHYVPALAEFIKILESGEKDYFLLRAVLTAASKIDHPDRLRILEMAVLNPSRLVSELAQALLEEVKQQSG